MTLDEIRLRRLAVQHLLALADTQTVTKDLCGLQAQFLSHALHGLAIRTGEVNGRFAAILVRRKITLPPACGYYGVRFLYRSSA